MNVSSIETDLTKVFSDVFEDLLTRRASNHSIVYQSFGSIWNIALRGSPDSVNIGEAYRDGTRYIYVQPRKPNGCTQPAAQKFMFAPDEAAKMSYLTIYYLLAVRGEVDLSALNQRYRDLDSSARTALAAECAIIDDYIRA